MMGAALSPARRCKLTSSVKSCDSFSSVNCFREKIYISPFPAPTLIFAMKMKKTTIRDAGFLILLAHMLVTVDAMARSRDPELKLISVVFRHGDRAPDPIERFPKDPNYNDTFYPVGLGGMTNAGKLREYQLGKLLRERYLEFLGDSYQPKSVLARSTYYKRAKLCLQLLLSSLYSPRGEERWHDKINWQPIPTTYTEDAQDWLMVPEECPEYLTERNRIKKLPGVVAKYETFQSFMKNLTELTGKDITIANDMYNLYHILVAEWAMNLTLPNWATEIFPYGKLFDGIQLWYDIFSYNTLLRRLNGGKLLHVILKEMQAIKAVDQANDRKILLFSGHETNVAALLQTLNIFYPHVPEYSSAVILELYRWEEKYYIQVVYYRGIPATFVIKQIPGCEVLCPINKFLDLLKEVIPSEDELACDKSKKLQENNNDI